jgi:hypothetical protein
MKLAATRKKGGFVFSLCGGSAPLDISISTEGSNKPWLVSASAKRKRNGRNVTCLLGKPTLFPELLDIPGGLCRVF